MKAETQRVIGLTTALISAVVGIWVLLFIQAYTLREFLGVLAALEETVLSALYFFALKRKRLTLTKTIYRVWWIIGAILLSLVLLIILIIDNWARDFQNLLIWGLLFGVITFLLWIGLRGLVLIVDTESKATAEIAQKAKISVLAIASLVLSTFLLMLLTPFFIPASSNMQDFIFRFGPFLALCTAVLGIAALIQRAFVQRSWWWLALFGIAIPVAWVVIISIWILGVAKSWH